MQRTDKDECTHSPCLDHDHLLSCGEWFPGRFGDRDRVAGSTFAGKSVIMAHLGPETPGNNGIQVADVACEPLHICTTRFQAIGIRSWEWGLEKSIKVPSLPLPESRRQLLIHYREDDKCWNDAQRPLHQMTF